VTGLHRIRLTSPPGPHPPSVNCLAFAGPDGIDLVDVGWDTPEELEELDAGLAAAGLRLADVRSVVATHWHPDHLGLASAIRERTGAAVLLGRPDAADAGIPVDRALDDGDEIALGVHTARAVATPGHTPGSICIDLPGLGLLLTGDTVLPEINPGLGLSRTVDGNPIRDYLASLGRIASDYADRVGVPGHGEDLADLPGRCAELAAHHRARTAAVVELLRQHPGATPDELAPRLTWTGGWESLTGITRISALRQTAWHLELATGTATAS
jgi:glyoxylase-like metal-dependent hydrolase (beta-lactamase superfamily II)